MIDTYITTENFEESGAHRGHVHITDAYGREDSPLLFCDLEVRNADGETITLHRVELGKLKWLVANAQREARQVTTAESKSLARRCPDAPPHPDMG